MKNSDLLDRPTDPTAAEKVTSSTSSHRHETPPGGLDPEKPSVIDTSKMSHAQREALELTEAARTVTNYRSFAGDLFMGRFALDHVYPFPLQSGPDVEAGRTFLTELNRILKNEVDPDQIDA